MGVSGGGMIERNSLAADLAPMVFVRGHYRGEIIERHDRGHVPANRL
ncbi:hypothetical protein Q3V37_24435 [Micromonospora profundi]|uniref:Uncharacterized protein n=1 Tax=Micromonospora profundi TaxID=1420889 RepID=A0AAJ6HQU2_9ACTN|nr:hypothetical protein [Micromonospora profundi]WLS44507.1 hypothetical protein Q3V37_24435 [Micromonospora profundi]